MNVFEYIILGIIIILAVYYIIHLFVKASKGESPCSHCSGCSEKMPENEDSDSSCPSCKKHYDFKDKK